MKFGLSPSLYGRPPGPGLQAPSSSPLKKIRLVRHDSCLGRLRKMMKFCTVLHLGNMYNRSVSVIFRVSVQCRKNEMPCSAKLVVHGPPERPNKSVSNGIFGGTTGAARAHQIRSTRAAPFMHIFQCKCIGIVFYIESSCANG